MPGTVVDEVLDEGRASDAPLMCVPSSGSSAMDMLSSRDATASCSKPHATVNASVMVARSFPSLKSAANGVDLPSAERNLSVRGSRPLRRNSCSSPLARDLRPSHTEG